MPKKKALTFLLKVAVFTYLIRCILYVWFEIAPF